MNSMPRLSSSFFVVVVPRVASRLLKSRLLTSSVFLALVGATCWYLAPIHSAHQSPSAPPRAATARVISNENPAVNLHESREVVSRYIGDDRLQQALRQNAVRPLSLTSGDFDEDGMPDLVAAYDAPGSGILVLHRGNVEAIFPKTLHAEQRGKGSMPAAAPFLSPAHIFAVPEAPVFIGAGDFDADGHLDIITGARESKSLYLLAGDGQGNLRPAHAIGLPGAVTALVTGEVNRRDGLADIVVGISGADGPQALIYESTEGALKVQPEVVVLPAQTRALALGRLNGSAFEDLAVSAGNQLLIVEGRDRHQQRAADGNASNTAPVIQQLSFSSLITAMVVGDFPAGGRQRVALLEADGDLQVVGKEKNAWKSRVVSSGLGKQVNGLFTARVSKHGGDDLVILDREFRQLQILSNEEKRSNEAGKATTSNPSDAILSPSKSGGFPVPLADIEIPPGSSSANTDVARQRETRSLGSEATIELAPAQLNPQVTLTLEKSPAAVLPMRLTRDATSSLIILKQGQSALEVMTPATVLGTQGTFTVLNRNDSGDGSLRQAILDANASPGVDTIIFDIPSGCEGPPCPPRTINLLSPLPTVTEGVVIDGYTQPFTSPNTLVNGDNAVLLIELNGASAGAGDGLTINAGSCTVRGLVINRFNGTAIHLSANGNNIIEGNFLGTNFNGTGASSNTFNGVFIFNIGSNLIGGTTPAARNIISGNGTNSNPSISYPNVFIGGVTAAGNSVQGNYIGTDVTGTNPITAIGASGVSISGAPSNFVGGPTAGARNLISGNDANGVFIGGDGSPVFDAINATANLVQNNFIGTNVFGTQALGNTLTAVPVLGPANTIGGSTANARNIIAGSTMSSGVGIIDSVASLNLVLGNFIGTDVNGTAARGNFRHGVIIIGASRNTIGGLTSGARNIISGNRLNGVSIETDATFPIAAQNLIQGNYIGTNSSGTVALGNSSHGVSIFGGNNGAVTGNLISGNGASQGFGGLVITATSSSGPGTGNVIQGNLVGTNVTGNAAVGNRSFGIALAAPNNSLGGTTAQARNIIAGNGNEPGFAAVMIAATSGGLAGSGSLVQGNFIGTAADGTSPLGNVGNGVSIPQMAGVVFSNVTIGGTSSGAGNVIAFNSQNGVLVESGVGHSILSNSIFSNGALGIDLNPTGVTPNDAGDGDTGANNLQNFPILTSAVSSGGNTVVQGTLNSTPSTTFNIQFFSNPVCDASGNGEGQTFIGSTTVTTNASGNATFNSTLPVGVAGQFVTATATDPNNNTSEFSACRLSTPPSFLQFSSATFSAGENAGSTLITVTRSGGNGGTASVQFSTAAGGSATGGASCAPGVDYITTSGTLNWADGELGNKTFSLTICNDATFEGIETVNLALANPAGATLGTPSTATFNLTDDDSQPGISINDVTQAESNSGTTAFGFTVSLSNASTQTVTVNYATANGTATAGGDYQALNTTTLTFSPGITSLPVNVQVIGDTLNEANETFFVNLTNATNATIADSQGVGTIINDDPVPTGNMRISGRIVDNSARSIGGVVVFLSGAASGSTNTDSNGNYSFTNLSAGAYTVSPSGNYSFSPANHSFNNLIVDRIANFVGTQTIVSITGRVTDNNDIGLGSITLGLTRDGIAAGTVSTDVLGNYGFGNLAAGSDYVVTPVGSFTASRLFFNRLSTNTTANFRVIPGIPTECGIVSYTTPTNFAVGVSPFSVKVGDLNNDSRLDIITANFSSNNVSILLANSTGGFGPATNFAVGAAPSWVALGDFNGDNRLDLVTTNDLNVSILLGNGAGGFGAATNFGAGARPASVVVADFNGDGRSDLAVANQNSSNVSILLGNGTGGVGAATNLPVGATPTSVALGDFNRDGKFDLVTANASATISVLLGTGTGGFSASTNFPVGTNAGRAEVADLNGDNKLDVIVTTPVTNTVSVLLGNGDGTFGAATSFAVGTVPRGLAVGDFNGDGRPDLVAANRDTNDASILLGNGAGSFGPRTNFALQTGPFSVAAGDFNNDGKQDLVATNENSNNVSILFNNGATCNTQTSATISGRVADANDNPLSNITVTLSGPITRVVSTNSAGNYAFANLTPGGNYAVTVQSNYFVFAPSRADFFNPGGSQTANFRAVPVVVPVLLSPPSDDFSGTVRDASRWSLGTVTQPPGSFNPLVDVSQVNGQLVITPLTQASGLHYSGYVSANSFDLRGGSITAELARPASGGADTIFAIGTDSDNFFRFLIQTPGAPSGLVNSAMRADGVEKPLDATTTQLIFQVNAGGQLTALSIDYDPILHAHLRFRHLALTNELAFETSPNNIDFTERRRITLSRGVSALTAELSAGTSNPANPGSAAFESVSLVVSTFQFSSASYAVSEGAGSILITVTRAGNTQGTDAVDFATADGTATQTTRYINTAGRLQFAAGETSKTFMVLIVDNALTEGDQNVNLVLQNPMNSGLNTPGRALLTITDNDTTVPTVNPLDDPTFYVTQHYYDFLNREPDAGGLAFWVNQITGCGSDTQCIELRRVNVSAAYFLSIEYQETGFLAHRFYNLALNRPNGLPRYLEFFRDTQAIGRGVVIGTPGAEALLEANKVAYANEFAARDEFTALYPLTQTPAQYVDALYVHAVITPSAAERQAAIDEFSNPTGARGRVLRRIADNATLRARETNRAFVLAQYFGYLRRNPDDAPDNNLDGYNFWLNKLNQFNGNFINADMVKAFITSGEYRHRFGP